MYNMFSKKHRNYLKDKLLQIESKSVENNKSKRKLPKPEYLKQQKQYKAIKIKKTSFEK